MFKSSVLDLMMCDRRKGGEVEADQVALNTVWPEGLHQLGATEELGITLVTASSNKRGTRTRPSSSNWWGGYVRGGFLDRQDPAWHTYVITTVRR